MIVAVSKQNLNMLQDFISNMGNSSHHFRYFNKRDITIVYQHIVTLLAIDNNKPTAYGHLEREKDIVWLGICVNSECKGKGYGKQIMHSLIAEAKLLSIKEISLTVDKTNISAILFYEKFGFEKKHEEKHICFYQLSLFA